MDFDTKFDPPPDYEPPSEALIKAALAETLGRDIELKRLSGGYSNINYLARADGQSIIARLARRPRADIEAEIAVLRHVDGRVPTQQVIKDPRALTADETLTVLSYLPGTPLAHVEDTLSTENAVFLSEELGAALAHIHSITFPGCGFFGPGLTIAEPMPDLAAAWTGHLNDCLTKPVVKTRLGELYQPLAEYIDANACLLDDLAPLARLTHSDFNTKNILVEEQSGRWRLSGILDWEFAFSGSPLTDFGNFFRFETEQPYSLQGFVDGYMGAGGTLLQDWRAKARFLDLAAMLSFLSRDDERPKTFQTARSVIAQTLKSP